jgi:uncharacterized protein with PIN domain
MSDSASSNRIPAYLKSFKTNEHFKRCGICNVKLEDVQIFAIEKSFHRLALSQEFKAFHEHAVCIGCTSMMQGEISEESKVSIQEFMNVYGKQLMENIEIYQSTDEKDLQSWQSQCSFTGKKIADEKEFTISGIIQNGSMMYEDVPIITSGHFVTTMQNILSKSTKEYFDGFKDEFYDLPPEIRDIVNPPVRVF